MSNYSKTCHLCSVGCLFYVFVFPLPGTQRREALCNSPLAQHCAEKEEDGSSSSDVTPALCLPSWSQTLLSACRSNCYFGVLLKNCISIKTTGNVFLLINSVISELHRSLFHCCSSQILSVTGFVDADRDDLKLMAYLAGARYTGYLCRSNTVLICKE